MSDSPKFREQIEPLAPTLSMFESTCLGEESWILNVLSAETQAHDVSYWNSDHREHYVYTVSKIPDAPESNRILFCIMHIATEKHTQRGGLCLHAAAVSRGHNGYLFLGESGAGKSTVALQSASAGMPVLGEDRIFLLRDQAGNYRLAPAPVFPTQLITHPQLRPVLHGVFVLVKDTADFIVPLPRYLVAKALFAGFYQNSASSLLSSAVVRVAFNTACAIARAVPGYELHFRKSPDFWKVIDAEFGF